MTIRSITLFIAGAVLAVGIGCKNSQTANTNATAANGKTDSTCCEKSADVNASATPAKKSCCEAKKADCCEQEAKECPAAGQCTEKKEEVKPNN
jgi:altronate dehydratase